MGHCASCSTGICASCTQSVPSTSASAPLQRKLKKTRVHPLLADLDADFAKYAGPDNLLNASELASIWKKCAARKVGKLSSEDGRLIEVSCDSYLAEMDISKDGKVSYSEFVTFMLGGMEERGELRDLRAQLNEEVKRNPERLTQLVTEFRGWDQNGDGFVTPEELDQHLLRISQVAKTTQDVRVLRDQIFQDADVDNDGRLDFWEVIAYTLGRKKHPVELLLYDVTKGIAAKLGPLLLGRKCQALHSGVLVFGSEYWYGGKIFRSEPPCRQAFGEPLAAPWDVPLETSEYGGQLPVIKLGYTFVQHDEFLEWCQEQLGPHYTGVHTYDLLTHSCNHFCNEIVTFLTGQGLPEKVFELQKCLMTPTMLAMRPWLNKYLGGFADAGKKVTKDLFSEDYIPEACEHGATEMSKAVLGEGDVVIIEHLQDVGGPIVAVILREQDGECDVKYYDPSSGEINTQHSVSTKLIKRVTGTPSAGAE